MVARCREVCQLATIDEPRKNLRDPEVQRFVRDKWALIEDRFAPIHFILFGSRVTGTPHEWSDNDAIIVSERFASILPVRRAYVFLTTIEPDLPMTILCYTREEFANLRSGIGVVADACKDGVWLK
jgi:hypothetical protein